MEQPVYVQAAFALDRVKALAPQHPEWKQQKPFKGVLEGDMKAVAATGERGLLEIMAATHAGTRAVSKRSSCLVHHTDATREWAYERQSHIGTLIRGLDEAPKRSGSRAHV